MLYYAAMTMPDGRHIQGVYNAIELVTLRFNPDAVTNYCTKLLPQTADEARDMASGIYMSDCETVNAGGEGLSYGECAIIGEALERAAQKFGLIEEFKENGII